MDRGKGSLVRDGDAVRGQLDAETGKLPVMHFTGTIRGDRVSLRVVEDYTDADPRIFTGRLHRSCFDASHGLSD